MQILPFWLRSKSTSSEWLRDFPTFRIPCHWVLEFLPAYGIHFIAVFAGSHDDAEFVASSAEVVGGLVTEGDLEFVGLAEYAVQGECGRNSV